MIEFECIDCHIHVEVITADRVPNPPLCLECRCIREVPEEDRSALRKVFRKETPA